MGHARIHLSMQRNVVVRAIALLFVHRRVHYFLGRQHLCTHINVACVCVCMCGRITDQKNLNARVGLVGRNSLIHEDGLVGRVPPQGLAGPRSLWTSAVEAWRPLA